MGRSRSCKECTCTILDLPLPPSSYVWYILCVVGCRIWWNVKVIVPEIHGMRYYPTTTGTPPHNFLPLLMRMHTCTVNAMFACVAVIYLSQAPSTHPPQALHNTSIYNCWCSSYSSCSSSTAISRDGWMTWHRLPLKTCDGGLILVTAEASCGGL